MLAFGVRLLMSCFAAASFVSGALLVMAYLVYNPWIHAPGAASHSVFFWNAYGNLLEHGVYLFAAMSILILPTCLLPDRRRFRLAARLVLIAAIVLILAVPVIETGLGCSRCFQFSPDTIGHYAVVWRHNPASPANRLFVPRYMEVIALVVAPLLAFAMFEMSRLRGFTHTRH